MGQITGSLAQKVRDDPQAEVSVIIRVRDNLDGRQEQLAAAGFEIKRRLSLINGFAATASGTDIQKVALEPWVVSVEPDEPVHTT